MTYVWIGMIVFVICMSFISFWQTKRSVISVKNFIAILFVYSTTMIGFALVYTILHINGLLFIIASTVVYFWIGMLSTKTVQVVCPSCNKVTKMLGRVDVCMYCNEPLTLDPTLEGKEFDEKYNRKVRDKKS